VLKNWKKKIAKLRYREDSVRSIDVRKIPPGYAWVVVVVGLQRRETSVCVGKVRSSIVQMIEVNPYHVKPPHLWHGHPRLALP
jgi:hypothetical protein